MSKSKRMTWNEIKEKYPNQWIGLTDVEYEHDNLSIISSAIPKYTDKTQEELWDLQIKTNGALTVKYTTPENRYKLERAHSDVRNISSMTWDEIQKKYPDQWVGLTGIKYTPDSGIAIESAIVVYAGKTKCELTGIHIETRGRITAWYTTPEKLMW